MSFPIDANAGQIISAMSKFNYAVGGALIGRKIYYLAACSTCKIGGMIARIRAKENVEPWVKSTKEYFALATQDLSRDLAFATGFFTMGFGLEKTGSILHENEKILEQSKMILECSKAEKSWISFILGSLLLFGTYRLVKTYEIDLPDFIKAMRMENTHYADVLPNNQESDLLS